MQVNFSEIQKIINYIEINFDREVTAHEIESMSHYSYRNFQRIFFKLFNETISGFQKRLRLENAYKKLIYTEDTLSEIAWQVGYFNIQSFSKAFKKQYSVSPTEARKQKHDIFKKFIEHHDSDLKIEIKYKDAVSVYCKFIKAKDYNNQKIDALWKEIEPDAEIFDAAYGIIRDQPLITNHLHCRYGAAVKSDEVIEGFQKIEILGGKYARFTHYGPYDIILETYRSFYRFWLSEKQFLLNNSDVIEEYEEPEITHIYFPLYE
ncbi:GyrI-like domain-containing protein [Chryseobacterium sp. PMSZPI]|uniref:AraC family transcriptional regulator n=1 Tax=Chryseobacterium sp. PMSZPI TaxID=1033900 RepID=UPI000C348D56|nr:AraC family transcriptional regulator [Chryseobacterium sp. PMSZPI]PKF74489.1 transcription activator effector-binding protein [Chryseobacterium sp. PMSZPI]